MATNQPDSPTETEASAKTAPEPALSAEPMDAETRAALEGSIRKWQSIVDGTGVDQGNDNCPLCQLFYDNGCRGCPVMEKTGQILCGGTPYDEFEGEWDEKRFGHAVGDDIEAAQTELDFLISLRPQDSAQGIEAEGRDAKRLGAEPVEPGRSQSEAP